MLNFSAFVGKLWPKTTYKMFDDIKRTNTSVSLSVKAELRLSLHRVFNLQGGDRIRHVKFYSAVHRD